MSGLIGVHVDASCYQMPTTPARERRGNAAIHHTVRWQSSIGPTDAYQFVANSHRNAR